MAFCVPAMATKTYWSPFAKASCSLTRFCFLPTHDHASSNSSIGVKEIERLIKKLELDKEILGDQDNENDEAAN
jgi:hypothetical protein